MNDAKLYNVIRAPLVSVNEARLMEVSNQYVLVGGMAPSIADCTAAVAKGLDVYVAAVNVVNVKGKTKASRFRMGRRSDWRKAYVTLDHGKSIDVMATA